MSCISPWVHTSRSRSAGQAVSDQVLPAVLACAPRTESVEFQDTAVCTAGRCRLCPALAEPFAGGRLVVDVQGQRVIANARLP